MKLRTLLLATCLIASFGCDSKSEQKTEEAPEAAETEEAPKAETKETPETALSDVEVTSSAFEDGAEIPVKYTCDGENISVPLAWSNLPEGTESVALVMHDPDAPDGTVYHWGVWAIPADANELAEDQPTEAEFSLSGADDSKVTVYQSTNAAEELGYTGPCPPEGDDAHRYIFEVFALDHPGTSFTKPPSAQALLSELQADAQARGSLTGLYKRQGK